MHAFVSKPYHHIAFRREPRLRPRHFSLGMRPATITDDPTWFVVRVAPRREPAVVEELLDLGFSAFVPMERIKKLKPVTQRKKGASHYEPVERALMPSYVFVGVTPGAFREMRTVLMVEHVADILRSRDGAPVPVPTSDVLRLAEECAAGRYDATLLEAEKLAALVGKTVRLPEAHALAGIKAKITKASRKGVEAEVFLLGATRTVRMSVADAKAGGA